MALAGNVALEILLNDDAEGIVAGCGVTAWLFTTLNQLKPLASFVSGFGQRHHAHRAERSGCRVCGTAVAPPKDERLSALVGDTDLESRHQRIGYGVALAGWRWFERLDERLSERTGRHWASFRGTSGAPKPGAFS